ncbi:Plasma membrane iron permease [Micractinium conductrix]|uniref:Plasma membrane iron permease n=1 Tax=Micractinium conductrix TaxID=554055 RepID=A0A2P6VGS2_9CHLO|nr:Plasma membrane iron permease [Micractinium conductrix]|eukprot:PSC73283.1 Plasma membrane iron permease [Micractinium conductrix]
MTLFSVPALLIMFREALEAAVVVSVLLQLVEKMRMPQLKKHVWFGALAGVAVSIVIGIVFIVLFYVANEKLFTGDSQAIFKGVISWVACLLITVVAFHMLKFYNVERKWRRKLEGALDADREIAARSYRWSIMLLAFSATLREGIESVLFLTGVSQGDGIKAIIIPGIVGVILGLGVGMLIFYTGRTIKSLKWFFILSSGLLLFIAAGLVAQGVVFFTSAGLFGTTFPYEEREWYNHILWDTSGCCNMYTNEFWSLVRALFGYTDQPTGLNLMYYLLYWIVVLASMAWKAHTGTLTDKREAQLDDFKSFARHLGEQADSDEGLGKGKSSAHPDSGSEDLESGKGRPEEHDLPMVESALDTPRRCPQLVPAACGRRPALPRGGSCARGSSSNGAGPTFDPDAYELEAEDDDDYDQFISSAAYEGGGGAPAPERGAGAGAPLGSDAGEAPRQQQQRSDTSLSDSLGMLLLTAAAVQRLLSRLQTAVVATMKVAWQLGREAFHGLRHSTVKAKVQAEHTFVNSPAGKKVQGWQKKIEETQQELPEDLWGKVMWVWDRPPVQKLRLTISMANFSIRLPALVALVATQIGLLSTSLSLPMLAPLLLGTGMLMRSIRTNASLVFPRIGLLVVLLWLLWFANSVIQNTVAYLRKQGAIDQRMANNINSMAELTVLVTAAVILLSMLGVNVSALLLPAGVVAAIASRDLSLNFLAGFFLMMVQPFRLGDLVGVTLPAGQPGGFGAGGSWFEGVCEKVDLRYTSLRQGKRRLMVPNSAFLQQPFMILEDVPHSGGPSDPGAGAGAYGPPPGPPNGWQESYQAAYQAYVDGGPVHQELAREQAAGGPPPPGQQEQQQQAQQQGRQQQQQPPPEYMRQQQYTAQPPPAAQQQQQQGAPAPPAPHYQAPQGYAIGAPVTQQQQQQHLRQQRTQQQHPSQQPFQQQEQPQQLSAPSSPVRLMTLDADLCF